VDSEAPANVENQELPSVLVIDDEPGLCNMLRFGLPKRGYQVTAVSSGEEAIVQVVAHEFDVVVCDIMMPGMGGVETLRRIKDKCPDLPVIMATGFATIETAIESMKSGAFDFVIKPYSLPQLCTILGKALEWRHMRARIDHLEELHRLKDEFLSTISHELRTPITVILGWTGLFQQKNSPVEDIQKGLGVIDAKAKGLLQIVNNILDFVSSSAKGQRLLLEMCSLKKIGEEVLSAYRSSAEAKAVSLQLQASSDLEFQTDRAKVKQILTNLVDNAVKFTKAGQITLRLEAADNQCVQMVVEDSGCGIEAQHIPTIFQEFRQIDQSRTREYGGAGLGLAVTNRFVELLGGQIAVTSTPGKGSTFTVRLPGRQTEGDSDVQAPPRAEEPPHHPNLLMVVDDDASITRLFAHLLIREGYSVSTANGGREAITQINERKPEVLLLDLMMPEMDGFEVLASIEANPALKGIRIFILTSKDLTPEERQKLEPRVEMILQKGSQDRLEIVALINENMKRNRPGSRAA
jgi:signal transduction histidine kinase